MINRRMVQAELVAQQVKASKQEYQKANFGRSEYLKAIDKKTKKELSHIQEEK